MSEHLGVCAVKAGTERQAQRDIERAGFGTRIPSYRVTFYRQGRRMVQVRPLFPGYVFAYLPPAWGELSAIEGVKVLVICGQPLCIARKDEQRLAQLERHCIMGDFNRVAAPPPQRTDLRARRSGRKPRRSKKLRARKIPVMSFPNIQTAGGAGINSAVAGSVGAEFAG